MAAVVSSAAAACCAASCCRWLTVAEMSCAVLLTESIDAAMTRPAQALRALAMASEARHPATIPAAIAQAGDVSRSRSPPVTSPPKTTGVRLARRLKCLSFNPFDIVRCACREGAHLLIGCTRLHLCPVPCAYTFALAFAL